MSEDTRTSMRTTARIAFRSYDLLLDGEREAVLVALVELEEQPASEVAQNTLHNLREARKSQLLLRGMLDGEAVG